MRRILRRFSGGRLPTLVSNGTLLVGGIVASVSMARMLGPEGRGEYVTWQALSAGLAIFAIGGLPQAIVLDRTVAGRHHLRDVTPALASTLTAAVCAVAVVATVSEVGPLLVAGMMLVAAANQLGAVGPSQAQRVGRMGLEFNVMRLAPQMAALVAIAFLAAVGDRSAAHWLVVVAGCQTAVVLAGALYALRGTASVAGTGQAGPAITGSTWRLFPANFATQVQYRFDLIAVAVFFPHATVAFYAVGVASQAAVLAMGQASGMYWFSRRPAHGGLRSELTRTMAFAAAAAVPLAGAGMLWVPAVYGAEFGPAVPVVALLSLAGAVQSVDYLLVHEVLRSRDARVLLGCRLPGLVAVVSGFLLARWLDWPVAALGFVPLVGYAASAAAFLFVVKRVPAGREPVAVST